MVLLGLLLLAACVVVGVELAISNTDVTSIEAFGQSFSDLNLAGLFLIGCALGALALLGLWMMTAGMRMARRRRVASRHEVKATRSQADELADENEELRAELDRQRERERELTDRTTAGGPANERDTMVTRDRDGDDVADRSERSGMGADAGYSRDREVYPNEPARSTSDDDTPAYDETAEKTHSRGMLGRLRDR